LSIYTTSEECISPVTALCERRHLQFSGKLRRSQTAATVKWQK
jgi:hypothetical protein